MLDAKTIYADYQATTPVDPRVLEKMAPFWRNAFGNPHSNDHIIGWKAQDAVLDAASSVANLIGATPNEIVFTSGATEANNLALLGIARRASADRRRILVSTIEHKCVLAASRALSDRHGFEVETIPVDGEGFIDLYKLEGQLDSSVLVVSAMAVNNEVGTIQNVQKISNLLKPYGTLLHCDAAQAPCAMELRELASFADLISLSGHKMYGPQGIGALFIRHGLQDQMEPMVYGGGQQEGMRSGTVPLPLCVGLGAAAELIVGREAIEERCRVARLRDLFVQHLEENNIRIKINGTSGNLRHPGNANIEFEGFDARDILARLQPQLAASTGAACTSGIQESSHVLNAMGLTDTQCNASIRFSFGRFTTNSEIESASTLIGAALDSSYSDLDRLPI